MRTKGLMCGRAVMRRRLLSTVGLLLLALPAPQAKGQAPATGARVSGAVYDSVAKRPLVGALVQLVVRDVPSVSRTTATDSSGSFQLDDVAAGTWLVGFYHPALDSLGLESPLFSLVIRDSTPVRAMLAIPAPRSIMRGAEARRGQAVAFEIDQIGKRRIVDGIP